MASIRYVFAIDHFANILKTIDEKGNIFQVKLNENKPSEITQENSLKNELLKINKVILKNDITNYIFVYAYGIIE